MGFLGPEKYLAEELNTALDERGNFKTPIGKYATSLSRTYAAGGKEFFYYILSLCFYNILRAMTKINSLCRV